MKHPRPYPERRGDGDAGGDEMTGDEYLAECVRIANLIKSGYVGTIEASKLLKTAVEKREAYIKRNPCERPKHNPKNDVVIRKGMTEWDVFHELSMKRLKKRCMNRFPKDCWGKNCPHFHAVDMSIDDLFCTCDILQEGCDACEEDFCFLLCPLSERPPEGEWEPNGYERAEEKHENKG